MCVCVFVWVLTHMCVLDREGSSVVAGRDLVVETAMYLTGYSDWPVCPNLFCHLLDVALISEIFSAIT